MVALVVGVSTMIRPMILEALEAVETRPALAEAENGRAAGDDGPDQEPVRQRIGPEELERLLAGTDEIRGIGER
jgi:hypothetical protein